VHPDNLVMMDAITGEEVIACMSAPMRSRSASVAYRYGVIHRGDLHQGIARCLQRRSWDRAAHA
jgi:hypothetical protein